jgi:acylpyruvate hydrolase
MSYPWLFAKGQDCFLPISRFVEKNAVKNPHDLQINLYINEEVKQTDNTGNMHYKIGDQLEYITQFITLNKGDLILTGTPHGIGPVKVGDKIRANLLQNNKVLVEMKYNVEEDNSKSLI